MPWEDGNSAIAGHRDGLFRPLKDIKVGDEIRFRTTRDEFRYRVDETSIVKPDDVSVLRAAIATVADADHLLSVHLTSVQTRPSDSSFTPSAEFPGSN